jgi:hypothetical protein
VSSQYFAVALQKMTRPGATGFLFEVTVAVSDTCACPADGGEIVSVVDEGDDALAHNAREGAMLNTSGRQTIRRL